MMMTPAIAIIVPAIMTPMMMVSTADADGDGVRRCCGGTEQTQCKD